MIFAAVGDTGYNIVLLLHILTVMAAFAPAFVHPFLVNQSQDMDGSARATMIGYISGNGRRVYAPALILSGIFGFALQGMSDEAWGFDQGWFLGAVIVWVAMNGVLHGVILPAERGVGAGEAGAQKKLDAGGGAITLLLLVMLWLMIFKPGL